MYDENGHLLLNLNLNNNGHKSAPAGRAAKINYLHTKADQPDIHNETVLGDIQILGSREFLNIEPIISSFFLCVASSHGSSGDLSWTMRDRS